MTWQAERKKRLAEEKVRKMAELDEYRKTATEEVHDGRVYLVVRIPDRYGASEKEDLTLKERRDQ